MNDMQLIFKKERLYMYKHVIHFIIFAPIKIKTTKNKIYLL